MKVVGRRAVNVIWKIRRCGHGDQRIKPCELTAAVTPATAAGDGKYVGNGGG